MPKKGLHLFFRTEGSESDSSSGDDDDDEEVEEEAGEEGGRGREVEWTPSGPQRALGDWEKYTTVSSSSVSIQLLIYIVYMYIPIQGIGSKLMAKMGYVVG